MTNRALMIILAIAVGCLVLQVSCDINRIRARIETARYCTRCHYDPQPIWSRVNPSTIYFHYSTPPMASIWSRANPSFVPCSEYTGPNLAPEGAVLNTAPDSYITRFNPSCGDCHGDTPYIYVNSTTGMASPVGNPVTYGGPGQ